MPTALSTATKFAKGFIRSPAGVGSIIPSSRSMERKIVEFSKVENSSTVVELGPGTGGTSRALLASMSGDCMLISLEIDPHFADLVRSVSDSRLRVHLTSAENVKQALADNHRKFADVVVSGIPFSTMTKAQGTRILSNVHSVLVPGGKFIAYQLRGKVAELSNPVFGPPRRTSFVWMNVPPMRVYCWVKSLET